MNLASSQQVQTELDKIKQENEASSVAKEKLEKEINEKQELLDKITNEKDKSDSEYNQLQKEKEATD